MKKSSLLLQRPVRTFEDDPEPKASPVLVAHEAQQIQPETTNEPVPESQTEIRPRKARTLTPRPQAADGVDPSIKFGPLTVDLAKAKKRESKGLITTTVPNFLHGRLMQQEDGPSGFINSAVEEHLRTNLNQVVEAGFRLAAMRVAQAEDSRTISARAPMAWVMDVDEAVKYVTQNLEKVSAAFIVGGCVMLSAEKKGLI